MSALSELRERVERATGPDRKLDADLFWLFEHERAHRCFDTAALGKPQRHSATLPITSGLGRASVERWAPRYTASIDAALALVERKLPGAYLELSGPRRYLNIPTPVPNYWRAVFGIGDEYRGWGSTAPLAILSALLRALESQEQDGG